MTKLDHLTIRVRDLDAARDWYVGHLGLKLEFEVPGRRTVALQDDAGLTLFLDETAGDIAANGVVLTFQVADVEEDLRAKPSRRRRASTISSAPLVPSTRSTSSRRSSRAPSGWADGVERPHRPPSGHGST
jgi:hypothetical protein